MLDYSADPRRPRVAGCKEDYVCFTGVCVSMCMCVCVDTLHAAHSAGCCRVCYHMLQLPISVPAHLWISSTESLLHVSKPKPITHTPNPNPTPYHHFHNHYPIFHRPAP